MTLPLFYSILYTMKDVEEKKKHKKENENTRGSFIASLIANGILLFLVNKLPDWNIFFIDSAAFREVLPAINISIAVQISGYVMLLFYNPQYLFHLANIVFGAVSIRAISVILSVFPFVFSASTSSPIPTIVKVFLVLGIVGTGISIIVHFVKLLRSLGKGKAESNIEMD